MMPPLLTIRNVIDFRFINVYFIHGSIVRFMVDDGLSYDYNHSDLINYHDLKIADNILVGHRTLKMILSEIKSKYY